MWISLGEMFWTGRSKETESRLVDLVTGVGGDGNRNGHCFLMAMQLFSLRVENISKLDYSDGCTTCEYTKIHWMV